MKQEDANPGEGRAPSSTEAAGAPDSGNAAENTAGVPANVPMHYVAPAKVKASLDAADGAYLIVDVRKGADYEAGHLPNSVSIDVDAARRGNYAAGTRAVQAGMMEATGSENGGGAQIALICYTGARCAQAATNILSALGAPLDKVFTMEGGMKAWRETYPNDIETW